MVKGRRWWRENGGGGGGGGGGEEGKLELKEVMTKIYINKRL